MKASDYEPDENGKRSRVTGMGRANWSVETTCNPGYEMCRGCTIDEAHMIADALEQQAIREDADKRLRAAGIVREKPQTESEAT